jgi:hypothetical protein
MHVLTSAFIIINGLILSLVFFLKGLSNLSSIINEGEQWRGEFKYDALDTL